MSFIRQRRLIERGDCVIVAVSGGADSLALLHLLWRMRKKLGCALHVASLDHGLRGEDGAKDVHHVGLAAQALGLPFTAGYIDVAALAMNVGIESAARSARYRFLAETARKVNANKLATAHHADDQAETVLMHLLRGAGLEGLRGMGACSPVPGHADLMLIRPLLRCSRAELEGYCLEHGLSPRHDVSNEDMTFTRNRIRRQILPQLEVIYPGVRRALAALADTASEDVAYIAAQYDAILGLEVREEAGQVWLPRAVLRQAPTALARRFVFDAARRLEANIELSYPHVIAALDVALHGSHGAVAMLPAGLHLRVDHEILVIERVTASSPPADEAYPLLTTGEEVVLVPPGTAVFGAGWRLHCEHERPQQISSALNLTIPSGAALRLRGRRSGDRFKPIGLQGHTQKISRWQIDHRVPRPLRERVPLLEVNGEIVAILWGERWPVAAPVIHDQASAATFWVWLDKE
ncbi:MAG: tRNA lysidine(34) synthetase TilS [Aggregatilineales bacterium]